MIMVTANQKKIIWTIVRKSGIEVEDFRDWLQRNFDIRSTRKLTERQAGEVIRSLNTLIGNEFKQHPYTWGITEKQIWKAKGLADTLGWKEPQRLNGLIKKMFRKLDIVQLNKTEGSKLIVALGNMVDEVERGAKSYA